jgi:leucine-rich repeat transmembrane neuronal protein 1/2
VLFFVVVVVEKFIVFPGSILSSCQSQTPSCVKAACLHGGTCREGWNRATCDCTLTGYVGSACHRPAAVLHLTGHEYMRVAATAASQADIEADDINIRLVYRRTI